MGGHRVKMADLRRHFESLGLKNVETFIASGNVIFDSAKAPTPALEKRIETHLANALGFAAPTCVRTLEELAAIAGYRAFPKVTAEDSLWIYLLREEPDAALKVAVEKLESDAEEFRVHGRELYWLCHGKMSEVSVAWPKLEKLMKGLGATARNVRTLEQIAALHG